MRVLRRWAPHVIALAALTSCGTEQAAPDGATDAGSVPAAALADYAAGGIWDAPWPDERLCTSNGSVDVSSFPVGRTRIVGQLLALLENAPGFATTSAIFFPLSGAIDPSSLPDVHESIEDDASVFVMDVDPASPERGSRHPIVARFDVDPGPFAVPNVLALLPLQGRPLHAGRTYAAVVTTRVLGTDGAPLGIAPPTSALARGERPEGLSDAAYAVHEEAMDALRELGVDLSTVAATAVFRTWDPVAELADAHARLLEMPLPAPTAPFERTEVFADYCVFHSTIEMPVFQGGQPPYRTEGGGWVRGSDGTLELQAELESNIWLTLPRRPMPAEGFPTVVFVRTGGGGDRPLIDRGRHPEPGTGAEPGSGPAMHFARAGFAGISVDGPLGGLRNPDGWDEQFAIFNVNNPLAIRDNVRQSALELALFAHVVRALTVDAMGCPDLTTDPPNSPVRLDTSRLVLMGHSMGATIAPLAAAVEPAYRALILSGAGASWIANIIHKKSPIAIRPAADALLGYSSVGRSVTEHDPALTLFQWAIESADTQVYAPAILDAPIAGEPRHVLMFQGILDTYIPPPVANALSLALSLDLGGMALDETLPEYDPLGKFLELAGRRVVSLPAQGNREGSITALVVQHPEDGIEDGHEVVFQTAAAQLQYRCFLESLLEGAPRVPAADATACE